MRRTIVGLAFLASACVVSPREAQHALGQMHTIQLVLDGVTVLHGANDALVPPTSSIAAATLAPFAPSLGAPHLDAAIARAAVVRRVAAYLLPYSMAVTTTSDPAVEALILVGGAPEDLTPDVDSTLAGIAPLDCGNAQTNNLAWVFAGTLGVNQGGLLAVAATAAHELGHVYGLEHTSANLNLMYSSSTPGANDR